MLVNDLDVRLINASDVEYYPWTMEPNTDLDYYTSAAVKGDNYRDNIEIIYEDNIHAGEYPIEVSHKSGSLEDENQDFFMVINGIVIDERRGK